MRQRIFYILTITIVILGFSYAGLVHSMVRNTVAKQALIKENRSQMAAIGDLEGQYIALKSSINLSVAEKMGFEEPKSLSYVLQKGQFARNQ